jgi:hypothetical protein
LRNEKITVRLLAKSVLKRFKWGMAKSIVIGFYSLFTSALVWKGLPLHLLLSPL